MPWPCTLVNCIVSGFKNDLKVTGSFLLIDGICDNSKECLFVVTQSLSHSATKYLPHMLQRHGRFMKGLRIP